MLDIPWWGGHNKDTATRDQHPEESHTMTWITTFLLFTASITGAIYGFLSAINAPLTPTGKILVGILAIALFLVAEARIKAVLYADNGEVATDSNGLADS